MNYQIVYERAPAPGHPMILKDAYLRRIELRERRCAQLRQKPIPAEYTGVIVEVNTSHRWSVERPQLVLGNVEERVRLRLKPGRHLGEGPRAFQVVREEVFAEYAPPSDLQPVTVYTDARIDIEVASVEHATDFGDIAHYATPRECPDPSRLRQHKRGKVKRGQRFRRQGWDAGEGRGRTFATDGALLSVSSTHAGQPVWCHMLVRLLIPPDYPLAIARSYLGTRASLSPDEAFAGKQSFAGTCYDVLFAPRRGSRRLGKDMV